MQFGFVLLCRLLGCGYSGFAVYWWVVGWVYYSLLWFTLIVLVLVAIGLCIVGLILLLCRFVVFACLVVGDCLICVAWFAYSGW